MCEKGVFRTFRGIDSRDRHFAFLPRLAEAGLAPAILHMDEQGRCLERCTTLDEWRATAGPEDVVRMKEKVIGLIRAVHAEGVCHRDFHTRNCVVKDDSPLMIDLELACAVAPTAGCFDLSGPSSGVPVAPEHVRQGEPYASNGVWWNSPIEGMARMFGELPTP